MQNINKYRKLLEKHPDKRELLEAAAIMTIYKATCYSPDEKQQLIQEIRAVTTTPQPNKPWIKREPKKIRRYFNTPELVPVKRKPVLWGRHYGSLCGEQHKANITYKFD